MKIIPIILTYVLVLYPLALHAQIEDKVGTSGFQFLKIGVGARETALAESGTAFAEGPSAVFWNVAGIVGGGRPSAMFFYNSWIASIKHSYVGLTVPLGRDNSVGVAFNLLTMGEMEETTIEQPQGTGRRFSAGDFAVSASFARRISDRFNAGVSVKYISERIWDLVADGWAFDFGLLYRFSKLRLGVAFKDFGTSKRISGSQLEIDYRIFPGWTASPVLLNLQPHDIRIPTSFHFGAGYNVVDNGQHMVTATANFSYFNDIGEKQNVGVEYTFLKNYSLRAGYMFDRDLLGPSFGAGVRTSLGPTSLGVDFSAVDVGEFGYRSQVSIILSF